MCDERRSTFSKVKIDEDGHSTTYYTSTLKRSTMIWSILAAVLAAIVSLIAIQAAVIAGIKDVGDARSGETITTASGGAIEMLPYEVHQIDKEKCVKCGACKKICPADAVKVE